MEKETIDFNKLSTKEVVISLKQDIDHLKPFIARLFDMELKIRELEVKLMHYNRFNSIIISIVTAVITAVMIHFLTKKI